MKTNIFPELSLLFRRLISRVELKLIPLHICNEECYLLFMGAAAAWPKGSGERSSSLIWLSFVNVLPVAICIRIFNVYRSYFWPFRFCFLFLFRFHFRFHLMFMFSLVLHLINYRICSGFHTLVMYLCYFSYVHLEMYFGVASAANWVTNL